MKHKPTLPLAEETITLPANHPWRKLTVLAGGVGVIFLILSFISGFLTGKMPFFGGYLVSFLFFLSIALGSMFFVLIHFASRAGWSTVVRRLAEFVLGTFLTPIFGLRIPLFLILFIPLLFGLDVLYDWFKWFGMTDNHHYIKKVGYLNWSFFLIRAAGYFLIWFLIARFFVNNSIAQDKTGNPDISRKLTFYSPLSLAAFALTLTFAAFDWIMSTDAHWFSTIFGVYYFAGCLIAIYAFLSCMIVSLRATGVLKGIITIEHDHDIGKLLFGFNVFWSYIAFSQFMLIWYSNIPEETLWFARRWEGMWLWVSVALIFGHFFIPFFFLMSRHIKRRPALLMAGSLLLLSIHFVDLYWLIMPNLYHHAAHAGAAHAAAAAKAGHAAVAGFDPLHLIPLFTSFIGIGGLFIAVIGWWMRQAHLVPSQDPRLAESISFENF